MTFDIEPVCRVLAARAVNRLAARGYRASFEDAAQGARLGCVLAEHTYIPGRGTSELTWAWPYARRYADMAASASVGLNTRADGPRWGDSEPSEADFRPSDPFPVLDTQIVVREAVASLPARDREVLWHLFWEGLDERGTAYRMGVSRARVRYLRDRALSRLRLIL